MKKSLQNDWIRLIADLDRAMEKKKNNIALSWLSLIAWWGYIHYLIQFSSEPFGFLSVISQQSATSGFLFIGGIAASLIGLLFLKKNSRRRTLGLLVVWFVILIYLPAAIHPAPSLSSNERQFAEFIGGVWKIHPSLLAGWFSFQAALTLHFVFRNQRAKLKQYWGLFLGGLLALVVIYSLSPVIGLLYALLFAPESFLRWLKARTENDVRLAGSIMRTAKEVNYKYRKQQDADTRNTEEWVEFGGVRVPVSDLVTHLMVIGSSGSGKSLTLKLLMQGCLPKVSPVTPCRAVVFDPKRTAYPDILGMSDISADVIILNPFDARASAYDLAQDFTTYTHFESLAAILIPERKGEPIWYLNPRSLVVGVLEIFAQNAQGRWKLSDLLHACDSLKLLTALLNSNPETQRYAEMLGSEKTALNIYSSLRAEIDKFRSTAALWDNCATSVSIREWLSGGKFFLLGENEQSRAAMQAINTMILTRMSEMLLAERDCPEPRTFIFIDELQSLKVESLQEIATKGRSKGICLLLAFQSILGMHEMYGKEIAETILAQCRFKGFLKQSDGESAAWSSKAIGDVELKRQQATSQFESIMLGFTGISSRTGATEVIQQKNLVIPAEFINIPPINPVTGQGMTGYYQIIDCHKHYEPWSSLASKLHPSAEYIKDFDPAPDSHQRLKPWTEADWERLGITEVMRKFHQQPEQQFTHTNTDFGGWE